MIAIITASMTSVGALELQRAATDSGIDLMIYLVDDPATPDKITRADSVMYRIGPLSYAKYENLFTRMVDSPARRQLGDTLVAFDKCRSYEILDSAGIPMPESVIIERVSDPPFLPGVIKIPRSNQGKGVILVENPIEYTNNVTELLNGDKLLFQQYIAESKGNDKRLIIHKNKLIAAMKRTALSDEFRANLHLGGVASVYEPTQKEIDIAILAVDAHRLPYAGVDIIDSNKGPLVLEINPSPGFYISTVSGIDVAAQLLKHTTNKD